MRRQWLVLTCFCCVAWARDLPEIGPPRKWWCVFGRLRDVVRVEMGESMSLRSFLLLSVALLVSAASDAGPFTIDDFSVDHPTLATVVGLEATSAVNHPDILGGNRDLGLRVATSPSTGMASVGVGGGIAIFDGTGVSPGHGGFLTDGVLVVFDYDGLTDDDAFELGTGLGLDVTNGGLTNAIALDFLSLDYDVSLYDSFSIALWDMNNRHAFLGLENVDIRSASPFTLLFPFDLTELSPESVVDPGFEFDSVGFVRIQLFGDQMSFQADGFRFASTAAVLEPSSLALLAVGAAWICQKRRSKRGWRSHTKSVLPSSMSKVSPRRPPAPFASG